MQIFKLVHTFKNYAVFRKNKKISLYQQNYNELEPLVGKTLILYHSEVSKSNAYTEISYFTPWFGFIRLTRFRAKSGRDSKCTPGLRVFRRSSHFFDGCHLLTVDIKHM